MSTEHTIKNVPNQNGRVNLYVLIKDAAGNEVTPAKIETSEQYDMIITLPGVVTEPGEDFHIIEFAGDGFAIKHPLSCRSADLFNCPLNKAAVADELHHTTEKLGRFRCELVDGHVLLGERIE